MLNFDGDASNDVIWFTDGPAAFDQTPQALAVMDEWMANIEANPRPAASPATSRRAPSTRASTPTARRSRPATGVWSGILDTAAPGACTQRFPLYSTSRIVAGGPIEGDVYKCATKPVAQALVDGTYAPWLPSAADVARLEQIFPSGVCDYSKPDVGKP